MSDDQPFANLMRRVRRGDPEAAKELVRRYEPEIRAEVRARLYNPQLRRAFDSLDICQSVLGSFFLRVAAGQYELNQPEQLLKLLLRMARNKLVAQVRREQAQRRDSQRLAAHCPVDWALVPDPAGDPSQVVERRELLQEFRKRLSLEERELADLRAQGVGWSAIVAQLGGTPESRRKQLSRAVDRVMHQLGLEDL
jgi:DNA-directed RNA polymerase specialized sigma24 family protein